MAAVSDQPRLSHPPSPGGAATTAPLAEVQPRVNALELMVSSGREWAGKKKTSVVGIVGSSVSSS